MNAFLFSSNRIWSFKFALHEFCQKIIHFRYKEINLFKYHIMNLFNGSRYQWYLFSSFYFPTFSKIFTINMCTFYIRKECNGITNKIILRPDLQKDKMCVDGCRGNLAHTKGNPPTHKTFLPFYFNYLPWIILLVTFV